MCRSWEGAGVCRNWEGKARTRRAGVCRSREAAGVCRSREAEGVRRNREGKARTRGAGVWAPTPTFADGAASNLDHPSNAVRSGPADRRTSPAQGVSSSQGPLRRLDCIRRGEHSVGATNIRDILPVIVSDIDFCL